MTMNSTSMPTALGHLRVVETGDIAASYCAGYLAGLGADVIKVEPPGGDPNRLLAPFAGDIVDAERGIPFLNANINRRSIALDIETSEGTRDAGAPAGARRHLCRVDAAGPPRLPWPR